MVVAQVESGLLNFTYCSRKKCRKEHQGQNPDCCQTPKRAAFHSCSENSSRPLAPHGQHLGSHRCSAAGLLVGVKSPSSLETCTALSLLRCFCLETRGSWCKWSRAAKITSHFSPSCGWCRKEVKIKGVWKVGQSLRWISTWAVTFSTLRTSDSSHSVVYGRV